MAAAVVVAGVALARIKWHSWAESFEFDCASIAGYVFAQFIVHVWSGGVRLSSRSGKTCLQFMPICVSVCLCVCVCPVVKLNVTTASREADDHCVADIATAGIATDNGGDDARVAGRGHTSEDGPTEVSDHHLIILGITVT